MDSGGKRERCRQRYGSQELGIANHPQQRPALNLETMFCDLLRKWPGDLRGELNQQRTWQQWRAGKVIGKERMCGRHECFAARRFTSGVDGNGLDQLEHLAFRSARSLLTCGQPTEQTRRRCNSAAT